MWMRGEASPVNCGRLASRLAQPEQAQRRSGMIELKSRRLTADDEGSAIELCYANGWTDGLPVIPPTASRIAAISAGLAPRPRFPA